MAYDTETFRTPDVCDGRTAIWYGPGGIDGDCATEVIEDIGGYTVREYCEISWIVDDFDPGRPFLRTSTWIDSAADFCSAAARGVEKLASEGGKEDFVAELPGHDH